VGGTREIHVNVRIIAATNRDLAKAVADGRFREDLYYRLKVFPVSIPPLCERPEDIPALAEYFVLQFNAALKKSITGFTSEAMRHLQGYSWPGNVRELKNLVERAVVLSKSPQIGTDMLPPEIAGAGVSVPNVSAGNGGAARTLEDVERDHIKAVLEAEGNNRSATARALGISRSTLIEKLKKYGVA
jgi:DNA-binding NtrC family response regulator